MEDGRGKMEGGRWKVEEGRWKVEDFFELNSKFHQKNQRNPEIKKISGPDNEGGLKRVEFN